MMFPILLDIDGVVLDWSAGFHWWMKDRGFHKVAGVTNYDLRHEYPSVDIEAAILQFANSAVYADLGEIQGARAGVAALKRAFPNSPIIAISCCGRAHAIQSVRAHALRSFPLDGFMALDIRESKKNIFSMFKRGVVIEDSPENLLNAMRTNHVALCFERPYNKGARCDHRVVWNDMMLAHIERTI